MGCGSCGTGGSSGGCSSGGCNRLNVFDWLADVPLSSFGTPFPIFEVSFNQGSRKEFFRNSKNINLPKGSFVTVEGVNGFDMGTVSLTGELVKLQLNKHQIKEEDVSKKLLRLSGDTDFETYKRFKAKEKEFLIKARILAKEEKLEMKISEVEIQADGKKVTIFYTANNRVDFRELLKVYANEFNARIEMRQIGARQEAAKIGGIGSCGRELCCSTWLTDFKTVYTSAARYQNLSINQTKLSGQCGKLKCCLNFELDTYLDALDAFPSHADSLQLKEGKVKLVKKDIFKKLMWYSFDKQSKQYPLSIERVNEIIALNKENIFPDELGSVEIIVNERRKIGVSADAGFVNDVGQISLQSLTKKKKAKSKNNNPNQVNTEKPMGKGENRNNPNKKNAGGGQNNNAAPKQQKNNPNKTSGQNNNPENRNRPRPNHQATNKNRKPQKPNNNSEKNENS